MHFVLAKLFAFTIGQMMVTLITKVLVVEITQRDDPVFTSHINLLLFSCLLLLAERIFYIRLAGHKSLPLLNKLFIQIPRILLKSSW